MILTRIFYIDQWTPIIIAILSRFLFLLVLALRFLRSPRLTTLLRTRSRNRIGSWKICVGTFKLPRKFNF